MAAFCAAWCVVVGTVLAAFSTESRPLDYLVRPLVAGTLLAVVIGGVAGLAARRHRVLVAVAVSTLVVIPLTWVAVGVLAACIGVLMAEISGRTPDTTSAAVVASMVFLASGAIQFAPALTPSAYASVPSQVIEAPTYVILLDGYPRADTLSSLGIDNSWFIDQLEARGFDYYPNASSRFGWTERTITVLTTGDTAQTDDMASASERGSLRGRWRLPEGFVAIAPPIGSVTIPHTRTLNPGGPTLFDAQLLRRSVFGEVPWVAEWIMDGFRAQLNRAFELLEATEETRVFAHLLAPHTPFLYDQAAPSAAPECWPVCSIVDINAQRLGITVDEWAAGTAGYLEYLNPRLLGAIDVITKRHPDATIVLFSDHGGRFVEPQDAEWHRSFLAARTPGTPRLFENAPHPGSIFEVLAGRQSG